MPKKDLVQIIRDNPGCVATIDNDHWSIHKKCPSENPHEEDGYMDDWNKWEMENELVSASDEILPLGDGGYGSGNCYGGDILQALAKIVGIKVESV
ncbi:MAG: hypothetical protein E5Y73_17265 [Mesorhizobium sp.]|uniref:hypothetical protein n=1 Tax=Mesorhizobium sp. TaxID=1871066 RepID=UPI00120B675C|nr:hypothetical protein [Mesorhizobium sp.]TIL91426.1 MAG: hypothetical protein E5Y73_17265 [Mesorhizobium sp.]